MKREELSLDYLEKNLRNHSIEVLDREGIVGKTRNGYYRMISKIIDPVSQKRSDFIVLSMKSYPLYNAINELYRKGEFTVVYEDRYKRWLHFNVIIPGTSITIDTKEYLEYSPQNHILNKINIFLFENEFDDYVNIVDKTLRSLAYLDGSGNEPTGRYY